MDERSVITNPEEDTRRIELIKNNDTQGLKAAVESNQDVAYSENGEMVYAAEKKRRRDIVLRQFRFLGVLILINIGLPLAIYYLFKLFTTQLIALICSGVPPLLRVFYTAFRYHVVDFISVICVLSFVISAALSVITGDIRATLLRDSFTTLIIGFAFLVTLIPLRIRHPPITWIDQHNVEHSLSTPDWLWKNVRFHRVFAYLLTAMWGITLGLEFIAKIIMIYADVDPDRIVLFDSIIMAVIAVSLFSFSTIFVIRRRKQYTRAQTEWRKTNDYTARFRPDTSPSEETV